MANITITLDRICAGQNHIDLNVSINGGAGRKATFTADELRETIADEVMRDAILVLLRLHAIGKTKAQMRTDLTAGIAMVI